MTYPLVSTAIAAGLFHPNCTHSLSAYIDGLTHPMVGTENPSGYEERQHQRYLERQVRKWKRREAVAITAAEAQKSGNKIREWQGELRKFTAETGKRRKYERESGNPDKAR